MKVLITEFRQESNSFNPQQSTLAFWQQNGIYQGAEVRQHFAGQPCAIGGFLQVLDRSEHRPEVVCGTVMSCQSGGVAEQAVMDHYLAQLLPQISENLPLDGVFISYHGALVTTGYDDPEGEITRRVRELVGDDAVIAIASDLHAYISETLIDNSDVVLAYLTYPHVDYFETGVRVATLGLECITAQHKPVTAWVPVPMIVPAASYSTLKGPFKAIIDFGNVLKNDKKIIDFSVYQMQPWLDIPHPNSAVVVAADSPEDAAKYARQLAQMLYDQRHAFSVKLMPIGDVITRASDPDEKKPVILVDSADSCNAGAAGDNMAAAAEILLSGSGLRAATVVNDEQAARQAHRLGVGATAEFTLGASRDKRSQAIKVQAYVKSLHDGVFRQEGPAGRGMIQRIGATAVLSVGNLDIVVCEWMAGNGDPQLYRAHGIEPTLYDLLVVKASTSFRVAYEKLAGVIYEANTPGSASSDLTALPFEKLPQTLYPWTDNELTEWPVRFAHQVSQ
ncbi:microcystin degradation protein MlrC [Raoultella sp. BIGb0138]|uniref:M81 family metallopeptidase n=1 Tax=Raoultella sp. BIGb0138 TaxID=2485115 RepID=UPI0010463B48|nr:M81 family metallopeptidase [Raoultella sp. BIGb0138]TCW15040.1 microcystin degradation protein MlrC [Raoultella sp. BIGb0138]